MSLLSGNRFAPSAKGIFDFSPLDDTLKTHLTKVYITLAGMVACASVGAYLNVLYHVGGTVSTIAMFALLFVISSNQNTATPSTRLGMVAAFGLLQGLSIGPLIGYALKVDPSIVVTAILGTTAVFVAFSISALMARRREYLALGGLLGSGLSFLMFSSLLSPFFPIISANASLYIGLAIFSGYVIYDTQVIVESFHAGNKDFVMHALNLFVDFVAIFVRILIILLKNSEKKDKRKNSRR